MTGKPSVDKPWLKYYPEGAEKKPLPKMTAYQHVHKRNEDYMGGVALEYYGAKITYATFFEKIDAVANSFAALGVKRGDNVTIMLPNTPEAVYCFFALNKIGACANMLSPILTHEHIIGSIGLTGTKILVILDKFYAMLGEVIEKAEVNHVVVVPPTVSLPPIKRLLAALKGSGAKVPSRERIIDFKAFIKAGKTGNVPTAGYAEKTPAAIVYSSGSTGAAKGIVLPNEAFVNLAAQFEAQNALNLNNERTEKSLVTVPLFFSTGINAALYIALCFKITADLEPVFDPVIYIKRIIKNKPNITLASPSFLVRLMESTAEGLNLSFMKYPTAGGEALPEDLEVRLNHFFAQHGSQGRIMKGWGMCEFGSVVTNSTWNDNARKGTGRPLSHVIVSAFDPDTDEELTYNERGEIRVITPCRMLGYYKNPEATAEFFREGKDGQIWGCSGDVGYIDEEGNVFIEGRANDFILSGDGNKIWLFDIENVLLEDEAVQLCEAVGLDDTDGQFPVAHLVLKQNCTENPEDIIRRVNEKCAASLSPSAVPKGYKIRDAFDVLPSGKRDTLTLSNERNGFLFPDGDTLREVNF